MPGAQPSMRRLRKLACVAGHPRLGNEEKTWMASELGLARVPSRLISQDGNSRVVMTSPAMTKKNPCHMHPGITSACFPCNGIF
jgi:hypothetical protein